MIYYRNKKNPLDLRLLKGAIKGPDIKGQQPQVFTCGLGAELPIAFAVSIGEYKDASPALPIGHRYCEPAQYDDELGTVVMSIEAAPTKPESEIRSEAVVEIKQIRGDTLDKFTKRRSGVQMVYDTNYTAATMFLAGDESLLRTGVTPAQHLSMGMRIGMTVEQFANYILAENVRLGPSAWEVEDRYLKDMVSAQYGPIENVPAVVTAYREWCDTVSGN